MSNELDKKQFNCPKCNATHVVRMGYDVRSGGRKFIRMKCMECGHVYLDGELPKKEWKD